MPSDAERDVLNSALEKYRPSQSEPIFVGGENVLKAALRLMTDYRLMIEEIKDGEVIIKSQTLWSFLGVLRDGRQHPVQTGGALRNRAAIF
jgi:hypothetical protein